MGQEYRNREAEDRAFIAAQSIRADTGLRKADVGLVLGTGWGDTLRLEGQHEIPFSSIPGFERLEELPKIEGHDRILITGTLDGVPVAALKGRLHCNETFDLALLYPMVRLQIEMLIKLGCRKLILTCAAGGLLDRKNRVEQVRVGDIVLIDGLVSLYAPEMPLYGGEFKEPEDTLDMPSVTALQGPPDAPELEGRIHVGGHVMVRGPFFEGRRYDKRLLSETGAACVGMSVLPEACVCALYDTPEDPVKVIGLAFITNSDAELHSHSLNQERARDSKEVLGQFLRCAVREMSRS